MPPSCLSSPYWQDRILYRYGRRGIVNSLFCHQSGIISTRKLLLILEKEISTKWASYKITEIMGLKLSCDITCIVDGYRFCWLLGAPLLLISKSIPVLGELEFHRDFLNLKDNYIKLDIRRRQTSLLVDFDLKQFYVNCERGPWKSVIMTRVSRASSSWDISRVINSHISTYPEESIADLMELM